MSTESLINSHDTQATGHRPLLIAINEDVPTLDPHHHLSATGNAVLCNIFEPLVCRDRESQPIPCLASSWELSKSQEWTFHLRPEARFHNGKTLTADDVVFSLERARTDPRSEVASFLFEIESITANNAQKQVKITTLRPNPFFLESLSNIMIVPAESPKVITDPVGTGPYRFVSYEPGSMLQLASYTDHWRQQETREQSATFTVVPDPDQAQALLAAGKIDLFNHLPPRLVDQIEDDHELWVESRLSQSVIYLELNPATAPFDDPKIRQAIDLAVDRDALMQDVTLNHSRPASQMLAPPLFGHDPELKPTRRDLEAAKKLIAEASPDGTAVKLKIETTDGFMSHGKAIETQLEQVGFEVEIVIRPWPELYADLIKGSLGAWLGFWAFDSTDAAVFFNMVVHSRTDDGTFGSANMTTAVNPELDAMIRKANAEPEMAMRRSKLQEISRQVTKSNHQIPLLWPLDLYGTRRSFHWEARKDNNLHIFEMARDNN